MILLYLASQSPRRRELLEEAGIPFSHLAIDVDESLPASMGPEDAVVHLARKKAAAGAGTCGKGWALGADTIVAMGQRILGKPVSRADAREMLGSLSGQEHSVLTGLALASATGGHVVSAFANTRVFMRSLTEDEIRSYVETGEPDDKAGAYAIQGGAAPFIERIEGSFTNVVGLPMELLQTLLAQAEALEGEAQG